MQKSDNIYFALCASMTVSTALRLEITSRNFTNNCTAMSETLCHTSKISRSPPPAKRCHSTICQRKATFACSNTNVSIWEKLLFTLFELWLLEPWGEKFSLHVFWFLTLWQRHRWITMYFPSPVLFFFHPTLSNNLSSLFKLQWVH